MSHKNQVDWLAHPRTVPTCDPHGAVQLANLEPWMSEGTCTRTINDDWFLDGRHNDQERAVQLCLACPVRGECLEFALRFGEDLEGVWGATTKLQRRMLLRSRMRRSAS